MNWKKSLVERLGNQCRVCNQNDVEKLDIGFLNDQEYLEDQYFGNKDEMYVWFVLHFQDESKYLQSVCVDCKLKKSEDKSIPLSKLEEFHFTPKVMDRQEIMDMDEQKSRRTLRIHEREHAIHSDTKKTGQTLWGFKRQVYRDR